MKLMFKSDPFGGTHNTGDEAKPGGRQTRFFQGSMSPFGRYKAPSPLSA